MVEQGAQHMHMAGPDYVASPVTASNAHGMVSERLNRLIQLIEVLIRPLRDIANACVQRDPGYGPTQCERHSLRLESHSLPDAFEQSGLPVDSKQRGDFIGTQSP